MIRAILFDFDDTLVDFRRADPEALFNAGAERCYAYLSAHELPLPSFVPFRSRQRWIRRRIDWTTWLTGGEPDARRALRRLCKDFGLQRDESCLAKLGWLWYEAVVETASVADDVIPTLTAMRDAGLQLGIVANTSHLPGVIDRHLDDLGLLEFFPVRAYSSDVGARKPHPHPFLAACEQTGIPAGETLFVGDDLKADIIGARRLGMATALRSAAPSRRAKQLADYVIRDLGELLDLLGIPLTPSHVLPPLRVPAFAR